MALDREHWTHVRDLLEKALARPPAERARLLDDAGVAPAVRASVEALLAADAAAGDEAGADEWPQHWLSARVDEAMAGVRIGEFRLVRLLASGGMGAVYEAEQGEPRRRVALKMLRPGLLSQPALARFREEMELLARLQHPGIAQVHAAGVHRDEVRGRTVEVPYFVMELVHGARSLLAHARAHDLGRSARIELFLQVCDAVQHGHGRAVLHRDLKPANLLVGADGRLKVIDFGIARPLAGAAADPRAAATGDAAGTLRYMSPEQLCRVPDLDVRSDVYALGVVLHELLSGGPPPADRGRAVDANESGGTLPRELRWIAAKALAEDRELRYASVALLAEDLRRTLRHEPVLAAPPGWTYRARKLVRRHRVVVAAALLLAGSIVAGASAATAGWLEARRQRREAETRALQAQEVVRFFSETLLAAMPFHQGPDVTMREVLERAGGRIDAELGHQPASALALHHAVGQTLESLGAMVPCAHHLRRADELARAAAEIEPIERVEIALDLTSVLRDLNEHEELLAVAQRAVAVAERELGAAATMTFAAHSMHATALARVGRQQEAVDKLRALLAASNELRGRRDPESLALANNLMVELQSCGRWEEAAGIGERLVEDAAAALGPDHRHTLTTQANLAVVHFRLGRFEAAERGSRAALAGRLQLYGEDHPFVARARFWLGSSLLSLDRAGDAVRELQKALAVWRARVGADSEFAAQIEVALAKGLVADGRPADAVRLLDALLARAPEDPGVRREAEALSRRAKAAAERGG